MQEQIEYLGRSNGENAVASRSTDANGSSIRRKIIFEASSSKEGETEGNGGDVMNGYIWSKRCNNDGKGVT